MVVICDKPYPKDSSYNSYFELYPFPLSDFQKYAIQAIVDDNHVLVTAHTGSGKTLPAEFAIKHLAKSGKKVIYTSPIKALSNQKFHDFSQKFPGISFGLFTGDIKTNPDADVLIMTTEILMNYLFTSLNSEKSEEGLQFQIDIKNDLACVVFDEIHYINDTERGQVWEKTILMLPKHIQMIMLSATIDNPTGFAEWCERGETNDGGKQVYLASTNHRVVPLTHYGYITTTESIFKHVKDKAVQQEIRNTSNKLLLLQDANGKFNETGYKNIIRLDKLFNNNMQISKRKHVLNQLVSHLRDNDMLPAIAFVFSRKQVEVCANEITVPLFDFDSKVSSTIKHECEQIVRRLPNFKEYLQLPEYNKLISLLEKGVGIHHSGMIPVLREIVELMISKKYIKLLFATESFAIGLDCPIKTAIFTSMTKFDGRDERFLRSHEYTQMAGRAGRRGIDKLGYVVHCNNLFKPPTLREYQNILNGIPQQLVSKYAISYSLILNLLKNGQNNNFHSFSEKSMVYKEIMKSVAGQQIDYDNINNEISTYHYSAKTPSAICNMFIEQQTIFKTASNNARKKADKELKRLKNEFRTIENDANSIIKLNNLTSTRDRMKEDIEFTKQFIEIQTGRICSVLISKNFITCDNDRMCNSYLPENTYKLTDLGIIASNIAEIHPIIISDLANKWNWFNEFTPTQLVGLFSCFTDIKVSNDLRSNFPKTKDNFLKSKIEEVVNQYEYFDKMEGEVDIRSGINYYDALKYDIIDLSMKWCELDNERDCKIFIENEIKSISISIGDFTKAMLKIVAITKEWITVCEITNNVEAQHKFSQIDSMILKYVMTSQSLYV
tara:strand:+ start:1126 stop:3633 length:2508 start_codon:yes stop_codon:yes gene_type:complete